MPKAGEPVMRQVGRVIYQTCRLTLALPKNAHPRLTFALPNLICLLSCATAFHEAGSTCKHQKRRLPLGSLWYRAMPPSRLAWLVLSNRDCS